MQESLQHTSDILYQMALLKPTLYLRAIDPHYQESLLRQIEAAIGCLYAVRAAILAGAGGGVVGSRWAANRSLPSEAVICKAERHSR